MTKEEIKRRILNLKQKRKQFQKQLDAVEVELLKVTTVLIHAEDH